MVEIEIAGPKGDSLFFLPLGRVLRGRVDFNALAAKDRGMYDLAQKWPEPLPGMRIKLDAESQSAELRDGIYDTDQAANRDRIAKAGMKLGPAVERFEKVDTATWAHWLRAAVASGSARVASGILPEVEGEPRLTVIRRQPDKRQATIDKLLTLVGDLLKLPAKQREQLGASLTG